jgi:hypothetical protein
MSVKQMALVWIHDFPHNKQAVMMSLADHADDQGENIYPSIAYTAWKTGYSPRNVQRIISDLVSDGVLVLVKKAGQHKPNDYRINWKKAKKKPKYFRGDNLAQLGKTGVPEGDPRGDKSIPMGDTTVSPKPSLKPSFLNHHNITYDEDLKDIWERLGTTYEWGGTRYEEVLPIEKSNGTLTLLVEDNFMRDWVQQRITAPGVINPIRGAYNDFELKINIKSLEELIT